jgi:hypothetical protein
VNVKIERKAIIFINWTKLYKIKGKTTISDVAIASNF